MARRLALALEHSVWEEIQRTAELFEPHGRVVIEPGSIWTSAEKHPVVDGFWRAALSSRRSACLRCSAARCRPLTIRRSGRANGPGGIKLTASAAEFGGAGDAVGRSIQLDGCRHDPWRFAFRTSSAREVGRTFDVPRLSPDEPIVRGRDSFVNNGGTTFLTVIARLRPDQSPDSATTALRLVNSNPESHPWGKRSGPVWKQAVRSIAI